MKFDLCSIPNLFFIYPFGHEIESKINKTQVKTK